MKKKIIRLKIFEYAVWSVSVAVSLFVKPIGDWW